MVPQIAVATIACRWLKYRTRLQNNAIIDVVNLARRPNAYHLKVGLILDPDGQILKVTRFALVDHSDEK